MRHKKLLTNLILFIYLFIYLFFLFCGKQQVWNYKDTTRTLELCRFLLFCFETDATVSNDSLGPHKGFVFGTWDKVPAGCAQQIGGGWWYDSSITQCAVSSNLNGIYPRCGKETLAAIHWGYLGRSAKRSAPTSTEMKIRPVEFMRVAWILLTWNVHLLNRCCLQKSRSSLCDNKTPITFFNLFTSRLLDFLECKLD